MTKKPTNFPGSTSCSAEQGNSCGGGLKHVARQRKKKRKKKTQNLHKNDSERGTCNNFVKRVIISVFFPPRAAVRVFPGFQDSISVLFLAVNLVSSVCVPQTVALCLSICVQKLLFLFHSLCFFFFFSLFRTITLHFFSRTCFSSSDPSVLCVFDKAHAFYGAL